MAEDIAQLRIKVDSSEVKKGSDELSRFNRTSRETESSSQGLVGSFNNMRMAAAAFAGTAGVSIAIGVLGKMVRETINAQNEQAQLNAVLRSTGESAGWSADKLNEMAEAMSRQSVFAAGDITNAQVRLLSYTGIVGQQFPRAMQAVIDMATRMGMSVEQSAETIGRALDIPSQGLTALTRQGFRFTDAQKELVVQLEETGRVAEAQNIVISALESSYGGAAVAAKDTLGGALASLKNQFDELFETSSTGANFFKTILNDISILLSTISGRGAEAGNSISWLPSYAGYAKSLGLDAGVQYKRGAALGAPIQEETFNFGQFGAGATQVDTGSFQQFKNPSAPKENNLKESQAKAEQARLAAERAIQAEEDRREETIRNMVEFQVGVIRYEEEMNQKRKENIRDLVEYQIGYNDLVAQKEEERRQRIEEMVIVERDALMATKDGYRDLQNAIEGFSRNAGKAIVDFAFGAETSFKGMVDSLLREMARLVIQKNITDPLFEGLQGIIGGGGGGLGSFFKGFLGGRAAGGSVNAGQEVIVGENGPERFRPSAAGTVIPNGKSSSSQVNNVSIVINEGQRQQQGNGAQLGREIEAAVMSVLLKQKRQGGLLSA